MENEQSRKKSELLGIARAGSASKSADVLFNEMLNVEAVDESIKPYLDTESNYIFDGVDKVFLHKTSFGNDNFIVCVNGEVFWLKKFDDLSEYSYSKGNTYGLRIPNGYADFGSDNKHIFENFTVSDDTIMDQMGNLFSFRDGRWWQFNGDGYETDYNQSDLKLSISFDTKPIGVAGVMQDYSDVGLRGAECISAPGNTDKLKDTEDGLRTVATSFATITGGLFDKLDDGIKSKGHIVGTCYIRYGIRSFSGGYVYISDPIRINGQRECNTFKKRIMNKCNTEKSTTITFVNKDVPPMQVVGKKITTTSDDYWLEQFYDAVYHSGSIHDLYLRRYSKWENDSYSSASYWKYGFGNMYTDAHTLGNGMRFLYNTVLDWGDYQNCESIAMADTESQKSYEDKYSQWDGINQFIYSYIATLENLSDSSDDKDSSSSEVNIFNTIKVATENQEETGDFDETFEEKRYDDEDNEKYRMPYPEYSVCVAGTKYCKFYAMKEVQDIYINVEEIGEDVKEMLRRDEGIASVDIFITRPINPLVSLEEGTYGQFIGANEEKPYCQKQFYNSGQCPATRLKKLEEDLEDELNASMCAWYLLKRYNKEDVLGWSDKKRIKLDVDIDLNNIVQQDMLNIDITPSDKYKVGYIYNNRLHKAITESEFSASRLRPISHNRIFHENDDDEKYNYLFLWELRDNGEKKYLKIYYPDETSYTSQKFANPISIPHSDVIGLQIWYKKYGDTNYSILRASTEEYDKTTGQTGGTNEITSSTRTKLHKLGNITYCNFMYLDRTLDDKGAEKNIYFNDAEYDRAVIHVMSDLLDKRYYLSEAISSSASPSTIYNDTVIVTAGESDMIVTYPSDPLVDQESYTIGFGKIIGFSSNATALSSGQFGEHPLYVFTTEGVWIMTIDTSGNNVYSAKQPISREVCNNVNSICQIDGGVIFSTEKGLMIIHGNSVECLSEVVAGHPKPLNNDIAKIAEGAKRRVIKPTATNPDDPANGGRLVELYDAISDIDFREYLKLSNTYVTYLYKKNKLLIYNKEKKYSYVYDLKSKKFTKYAFCYEYPISNYPNDFVTTTNSGSTTLHIFPIESRGVDFQGGEEGEPIDVMLQSRAIKLGTENIKSTYKCVLKGLFKPYAGVNEDKRLGIYVFGSLDCEKWSFLGGNEIECKNHETLRDLGCKVERMGAKYLQVLVVGSLYPDSEIDSFEISDLDKYTSKTR